VASEIDLVIGDRAFAAFYGIDRPDVAEYFGMPGLSASGFAARLAGAELAQGGQRLSIRVLAADRSCYYEGPSVQVAVQ
jgi:hypothetical protein